MTDNVKATALIRQTAVLLAETAEAHRREPFTMNTSPFGDDIIDYSTAAQMIATAMGHLDESLPNGQKVRTEQAVLLATIGLGALKTWLNLKGYNVGPVLDPQQDDQKGVVRNCFRFIMTDSEGKTVVTGAHSTQDPHETHRVMSTALELTEASRRGLVEVSDELFSKRVRGFNVPTPRLIAELKTMVTPQVPALLKTAPPDDEVKAAMPSAPPFTSDEFIKGSTTPPVECDPAWQLKADKLVPWRGAPPPSDSVSAPLIPDDAVRLFFGGGGGNPV